MLILFKYLPPQSTGRSVADRCAEHWRGVECDEPHAAAVVAEWLRRWTRNPMGYARAGSNPVNCEYFLGSKLLNSVIEC